MKTFLSRATIVAIVLASCLINLPAQAQTRPSGTSVAVIDIMVVFQAHPQLKAQLESLKAQMDAYEAEVRNEQKKVQSLAERLKTLVPGTPEYAAAEKEYASVQTDLGVQVRQKQREFLEQEAQMRYRAYESIQQKVTDFCQQYGIQLVIRFNRDPIDNTKPQEVMIGIQRPIVYQSSLDITNHIIRALGGEVPAPQQPTSPATGTATRAPIPPRPVR